MKIETSGRLKSASEWAIVLMAVCLFASCKRDDPEGPVYGRFEPAMHSEAGDSLLTYAVIEIPAGTAIIRAVDSSSQITPVDNRPVDFLPFPGNYGFVAGCAKTDTLTGDVRPLPVMLMMPALESGSVVAIRPLAVLMLTRDGDPYPVIVAVPRDPSLQSLRARTFVDLLTEYDAARDIVQTWFLNYLGREMFELAGWKDEHYARQLIAGWKITP